MRRLAAGLALLAALAGCTTGPGYGREREIAPTANPSAVVATELAFARAAQEKGQWTAFREFAAKDAVMFVPGPVKAQDWLKEQANPAQAVRWQPHMVWSSCDGSLAVTKGAWQRPNGTVGYFTTVWQRQDDGSYKWVLDQGDVLDEPMAEPEMIAATVADCQSPVRPPVIARVPLPTDPVGKSRDGTLTWTVSLEADRSRTFGVEYWDGTTWQTAISQRIPAQ